MIGRSYSFVGSSGGAINPVIPVPAGMTKARILKARVAIDTALSGVTETFQLKLDSTVIAEAVIADGAAAKDFTLSATAASANTVITSGTAIATGMVTFAIPQFAGAYLVTLDIEWGSNDTLS
jgi:hypothetical protein